MKTAHDPGTDRNESRPLYILIYAGLLLTGIFCVGVGLLLEKSLELEQSGASSTARLVIHILTEFGVAAFISFFLALTIENLNKREFKLLAEKNQSLIKENVFHFVFGQSLPEEINKEIESQLLRSNFVKEMLKLEHRISPYPSDDQYVLITTLMQYDIVNVTHTDQTYKCRLLTDDAPHPSLAAEARIQTLQFKVENGEEVTLDEEQLNEACSRLLVSGHMLFEREFKIPGQGKAHFAAYVQGIKRHDYDYDIFTSTDPARNLTIIVQVDTGLNLQVDAYTLHPAGAFTTGISHSPAASRYHWELDRPVLRSQGGFITLKRVVPFSAPISVDNEGQGQERNAKAPTPSEGTTSPVTAPADPSP